MKTDFYFSKVETILQKSKDKTTILGTITLFLAVALNFRHTLDDYGVRNNNLYLKVLAQSNSAGGSGNGSNVGGGDGGIPDGGVHY